ncbi:phosphotransferase family protein [Paracoccus seriniphilus]|uniref:Predicted kinase, aminoglycoside phosphotransferase (APT) family n=1 Tax=Paracoccus seriniphilus TaxID=184748 RepID=A0A239PR81_9RHOB|nr:phosphotransferase family protein [Paracoccus seriniphilus]WCR12772.1 phosphotransferase family protein [Paracoccus seriniphilus]SNT72814.1 Predicted kinase, aminoglycoside phosphotransferase (APT) family [Paracoccus seriniphilus]
MSENGGPPLVTVSEALSFDEAALQRYLADILPGFDGPLTVRQFNAGQSNPTYQLAVRDRKYVLRKKPPGTLLPSAHAVDREYRVMEALRDTPVPVPRMLHLCRDASIIGSDFYVMEMVEGRVFHDPSLPGLTPPDRRAFYDSFIKALADLHAVRPETVGLADFGRPQGFLSRQVQRWSKQYVATETETIAAMDKLMDWLPANLPQDDEAAIVHGDFRPGNAMAGQHSPEVIALLDWELCTLGHPLADLGYVCANYHADQLPTGQFKGLDFTALGIPTEQEFLDLYCHYSGRDRISNHLFFVVFSFFRSAAIIQGVYKRGLEGNASSRKALSLGHLARVRAENAWRIVEQNF